MRIGTVLSAAPTPGARRPAYLLEIDFGPELGRKKASAQVTELYALEQLVGRQVAAVVNFPPKQIAQFVSEVLVLGFPGCGGARDVDQRRLPGAERRAMF